MTKIKTLLHIAGAVLVAGLQFPATAQPTARRLDSLFTATFLPGAPGAAVAALVDSILNDQKKLFPCCVYLDGEYGQKDICLGVPVIIGKNGWEQIVDVKLNDDEKAAFAKSAEAVRNMNNVLSTITV